MMDKKTVGDIAVLAALSLTDEEKEQAWEDMSRMVSFFDRLKQADVEGISGYNSPEPAAGREDCGQDAESFRKDVSVDPAAAEEIRSLAPQMKDDMFIVPRTV